MKILAIDTATEACSAALLIDQTCMVEYQVAPQQHSQLLLSMVEKLLSQAQVAVSGLDGLVFGRGPGSFTGVRIATGMAQGLAMSANLPVVGVSSLATMAQAALHLPDVSAEHCIAAIDARMGEVYFGIYSRNNAGIMVKQQDEVVLSPEEASAKTDAFLASVDPALSACTVGTGWDAYKTLQHLRSDHKQLHSTAILYPSAEFMPVQAESDFQAGNTLEPQDIQPLYIRDKVTWKKLPGR